jgi:hypothetical protein
MFLRNPRWQELHLVVSMLKPCSLIPGIAPLPFGLAFDRLAGILLYIYFHGAVTTPAKRIVSS